MEKLTSTVSTINSLKLQKLLNYLGTTVKRQYFKSHCNLVFYNKATFSVKLLPHYITMKHVESQSISHF